MSEQYYWVYLPERDEAGTVVQAESFEDAFRKGYALLMPDAKAEVQIHELGESETRIVPNYPFCDEDACDDFCSHHTEGCDGYCDHGWRVDPKSGIRANVAHRNACLNDAEYEARCKEYDDA